VPNVSQFQCELATSELVTTDSNDIGLPVSIYDSTIRTHAPLRTVRRRQRPESPWFDTEYHLAKLEVRRLESTYYSRSSPVCYRVWWNAVVQYNQMLREKQESYWSSRVREAGGNAKELWKAVSCLMVPQAAPLTTSQPNSSPPYSRAKSTLFDQVPQEVPRQLSPSPGVLSSVG